MSLHLPTVAAGLAVLDREICPLEHGPGFRPWQRMEVTSVGLPGPMTRSILEGLHFTRGDGSDMRAEVHHLPPDACDAFLRPRGHDRLVGVEWRLRTANGPCPPVVMWPRKSGPSWETIVVLWSWVTIRGVRGHAFTAPWGTAVDTDRRVALHLTAEPLTTHVVVVTIRWGAESPHPWRDPVARALWRDLPTLRVAIWLGAAGKQLLRALARFFDSADAFCHQPKCAMPWRDCIGRAVSR